MSTDGRYIWHAVKSGRAWDYNAQFPQYQLAIYDRETGETFNRSSRYGSAFRPTLSPDGESLVYATRHEDQTGLRIRDLIPGTSGGSHTRFSEMTKNLSLTANSTLE